MLLFALIFGLILGFMLRGRLEGTWIGRLLWTRKDTVSGGRVSDPRSLFDRARRRVLDGLFGSKKDNNKPGGRK